MGASIIPPLERSKTRTRKKSRAEDTAVENRSILIKSVAAQNVCTSCFCRHEKILQSVSFPSNGKNLLTLSAITSAEYSKEFKVPV